jgi:ribosomal protein S18 acetylase RimI-like enzyme
VSTVRRLDSHAALLEATRGDAFVRFDLPDPLDHPAYQLGSAVATLRHTHTRALGLLVMGPPGDAGALVGALVAEGVVAPSLTRVTATRGSLDAVAAHLVVGVRNDWEWMCTQAAPPVIAGEERLVALAERDRAELDAFLAVHNDRTDARPFQGPGQHWVAVRGRAGELVACGVREPGVSGYPVLAGITVHPDHRGSGLGLAVTARLTRDAVAEQGVSVLGLYSDNAVARRLYHGLGYGEDHLWSSHRPHG